MTDQDRITKLERRVEEIEGTLSALASLFQRVSELMKGIGTKLAELASMLKK